MSSDFKTSKNEASRKYRAARANDPEYHARNRAYKATWYKLNYEAAAAQALKYKQKRMKLDPFFKLKENTKTLVLMSFRAKGWSKTTRTQALLGCSYPEFIAHLHSKFKEGMTLENHGAWHIDHIKPCATAATPEELAQLFHFTNLQPLWASENLSKGSTYHG